MLLVLYSLFRKNREVHYMWLIKKGRQAVVAELYHCESVLLLERIAGIIYLCGIFTHVFSLILKDQGPAAVC